MEMSKIIKCYDDTFGIENVVIISDNQHVYSNNEGNIMIVDYTNENIHSIRKRQYNTNTKNSNSLFEFEATSFDNIQFVMSYGDTDEVKRYLDYLQANGAITADQRKIYVAKIKDTFRFAIGYGVKPEEYTPTDKAGKPLELEKDGYSINSGSKVMDSKQQDPFTDVIKKDVENYNNK